MTKGSGQVSNVGQITMHTSAGVLESNPGRLLDAGESETLFLANRLIKETTCAVGATACTDPGTVVIVTIADYGAGGQLFVRAAKVGPDGQVTIVTQNIGATAMTLQYKVRACSLLASPPRACLPASRARLTPPLLAACAGRLRSLQLRALYPSNKSIDVYPALAQPCPRDPPTVVNVA